MNVARKMNMFGVRLQLVVVSIFALMASAPVAAQQFARPNSTVSAGGFTAVSAPTLWEAVDEVTASDTDYINSGNGNNNTVILGLSAVTDPGIDTDHVIRWRCRSLGSGGPERCDAALYQGNTLIEGSSNTSASRNAFATNTYTITNASTITDYSALRLHLTSSSLGGSESVQVSWAELQVPAAAATAPTLNSSTLQSLAAVTASTATLGGNITSNGNSAITSRGTVWGLSASPTGNQLAEGGTATGAFSHLRTGLNTGTQIHFRSYATNSIGTSYGPNNTFYTEPATSPASATIDNVADVSFRISWPANPAGSGNGALVVVSTNAITGTPTDGAEPAFNNQYGAGGTVGTQQYVVYRGTGANSVTVTGLTPSVTYNVAVFYSAGSGTGETGINYRQTSPATNSQATNAPAVLPTVGSPTIGTVTATTAILGGTVTADGGAPVTDRGIVWNTTSPAQSGGTFVSEGSGLGLFTKLVGSLPPGTQIFFKAYATNSVGTAYSGELSFTTLVDLPTLTVSPATSITSTSAFLGGTVTSDGGDPAGISERGTVWGTSPSPTGNALAEGGTSIGVPFSHNRTGLPTGVTVYFRAYATNSAGTAYSADSSFVPSEPPILSSPTATNITYFSAVLGGTIDSDGGNPILSRGTVWNTTGTPATENALAEGGTAVGVPFAHTRFLPLGTTIYYRAYATSAVGTGYSPQASFTTSFEPTVQASNITFPRVAARSLRIEWTRGNGEGSIVVVRTGTQVHPADNTDYTANPDFTLGQDIGSGNKVVYKGANNAVVVTGLTELTTYHVSIYEYAGTGADTYYLGPPEQSPAQASQATSSIRVHNLDYGIDCDDCHNAHGAFLPRDTVQKAVCETCHNPSGQASGKLEFDLHLTPNKNPAVDFVDCGSCHELHNPSAINTTESLNVLTGEPGVNKSFLRANVEKYIPAAIPGAGSLQNDTYSAADPLNALTPERAIEGGNDSTARGYCQVCHSLTNYHRSSNTAGSNQCHDGEQNNSCGPAETNCGRCHQHNNKFIGSGGSQTCLQCHSSAQGTRPIITDQFSRLSHHVPGTLSEVDCEVCHDQGGHQGGKIILWNVDDHAQPSFVQPTAGAPTLSTGQGVAYEGHCLSCHDGNGAQAELTPLSPFTGSSAPPVISSAAWNSSGHKSSTPGKEVTCLGDGTNGCHGSGHGSEQLALLAPAGTGPAIAPIDFCFNCHDANGPSSINVQAQFGSSTPDASLQTVAGSGALVNQRHDIYSGDQAYSGGSVTCKDCHRPHADSAANPVVDIVTGTTLRTYNIANSYTRDGNNFAYNSSGNLDPTNPAGGSGPVPEPDYIQFCLTCHDGTTPAGVTMSANMTNIAGEWGGRQHGGANGSTGSKTGKGNLKVPWTTPSQFAAGNDPSSPYAALNCTTCHGAHGTGSIFNLRESINVAGTDMTVGAIAGSGQFPVGTFSDPDNDLKTYTLPVNGGSQNDHQWGAWCTFCHDMTAHAGVDETTTCTSAHQHGSNSF